MVKEGALTFGWTGAGWETYRVDIGEGLAWSTIIEWKFEIILGKDNIKFVLHSQAWFLQKDSHK